MNVDGNDLFLIQQGMTTFTDIDDMLAVKLWLRCVLIQCQLCLCKNEVELCHGALVHGQFVRMARAKITQLRENVFDLFLLLKVKLLQLIVKVYNGSRLDEKRRTAGGLVVHHARHLSLVF